MTELLEKVFHEAAKLSQEERDALAEWILQELTAERRWRDAFADSAMPWPRWPTKPWPNSTRVVPKTLTPTSYDLP
jgi:hypothetical protein